MNLENVCLSSNATALSLLPLKTASQRTPSTSANIATAQVSGMVDTWANESVFSSWNVQG